MLAIWLHTAHARPQAAQQAKVTLATDSLKPVQDAQPAGARTALGRLLRGKPAPAPKPKQVEVQPVQQQPEQTFGSPRLGMPYPNPASTEVRIEYTFGQGQTAILTIYDFLGKAVRTLTLRPGSSSIVLDVANLPPGIYFYSLEVDGKRAATKRLSISR